MPSIRVSIHFLLLSVHYCGASFYATTNTVRALSRQEQALLPALYKYQTELQKQYETLKSIVDEIYVTTVGYSVSTISLRSKLTIIDLDALATEITQHPFKSLALINRFVDVWPKVKPLISEWTSNENALTSTIKGLGQAMELPGQEAIIESMTSLIKLKRTYNLPMASLIRGNLKGIKTKSGLNANHCYELGRFAMRYQIFTECVDIFVEGIKLARRESVTKATAEGQCYQKTKVEQDLESLLKVAIERHDFKLKNGTFVANKNPFHFLHPLEGYPSQALDARVPNKLVPDISVTNKTNMTGVFRAYEKICDGLTFKTPNQSKTLLCRLENRRNFVHPYYLIQPLRLEIHHEDPIVVQIHDVLTANEIRRIIKEAQPRLTRSLVVGENSTNQAHFGRTSSNTFITDYAEGSQFHYISKRAEMMVGLKASIIDASEDLQVANYGPGEFYGPHFDAGDNDEDLKKLIPFQEFRGDRLATFMIYLNDLKKGGSTAFPRLGISVKPKKGSAVFWYNLRHDGSQEPLSLHAGCPVLYGTKWIANKWIRVNEQTFVRKCPLIRPPTTI